MWLRKAKSKVSHLRFLDNQEIQEAFEFYKERFYITTQPIWDIKVLVVNEIINNDPI